MTSKKMNTPPANPNVLTPIGGVAFAITVLALASQAFAAPPPPTLKVKPLPEGTDGVASVATSLVTGDFNGDGRPDLASAGRVRQAGAQMALPALWFTQITHTWDSDLYMLAHEGFGGCVNAFTVDSRPEITFVLGGYVNDANGRRQAAIWSAIDSGVDRTHPDLCLLGTPPNTIGEVLDIETIEIGSHLIIVVCGRVTDVTGGSHAVVWAGTPEHGFSRDFLPPLVAGGDSTATSLALVMSDDADGYFAGTAPASVVGASSDADGNPQAVLWRRKNGHWQPPKPLGNLPGGSQSNAYTLMLGPNVNDIGGNAMLVGGQAENWNMEMVPVFWLRGSGAARVTPLPLLAEWTSGRITDIIDGTSNTMMVGEASGPQGSVAALFSHSDQVQQAYDLNTLANDLPPGIKLRVANAIARYMDDLVGWNLVGTATDQTGTPHAYVARLYMD